MRDKMNIVYRKRIVENISTIEQITDLITDKNFKKLTPLVTSRIQKIIDGPNLSRTLLNKEINKLFKYSNSATGMMNINYWINRGHSEEEGTELMKIRIDKGTKTWMSNYQKGEFLTSGSREYLERKGLTKSEINEKFSKEGKARSNKFKELKLENPKKYKDIQSNQIGYWTKQGFSEIDSKLKVKERQTTFSLDICIKKHGEVKGLEVFNKRQAKYLNSFSKNSKCDIEQKKKETRIKRGLQIPDSMLSDKELYYKEVLKVTNMNRKNIPDIEKIARSGKEGAHHLDHRYSVKQGFLNNILPIIIGDRENLEVINAIDNCSKQDDCSITLECLFNKILS